LRSEKKKKVSGVLQKNMSLGRRRIAKAKIPLGSKGPAGKMGAKEKAGIRPPLSEGEKWRLSSGVSANFCAELTSAELSLGSPYKVVKPGKVGKGEAARRPSWERMGRLRGKATIP